jgi:hypothetical protein
VTSEQSLDMRHRTDTLKRVLETLEALRDNPAVTDGDAAVEWVIEQLTEAGE